MPNVSNVVQLLRKRKPAKRKLRSAKRLAYALEQLAGAIGPSMLPQTKIARNSNSFGSSKFFNTHWHRVTGITYTMTATSM